MNAAAVVVDSLGNAITKGCRVLVPKGTPWASAHPKRSSGIFKRSQTIFVHELDQGGAKVIYAGSSGYWTSVPASCVTLVEAAVPAQKE